MLVEGAVRRRVHEACEEPEIPFILFRQVAAVAFDDCVPSRAQHVYGASLERRGAGVFDHLEVEGEVAPLVRDSPIADC